MNPADYQPSAPGRLVQATVLRRRGTGEAGPTRLSAFVPDPLPPKVEWDGFLGRLAGTLGKAMLALGRLEAPVALLPHHDLLVAPSVRLLEAKSSSQIEDTVASIEELALAEISPEGATSEAREVRNYVSALEHGLTSRLPWCRRLIREMHRILLKGVRGDEKRPGEFRTSQVFIGSPHAGLAGIRFVPPPPGAHLEQCLDEFEQFLNPDGPGAGRARPRLPDLVEIALAHYQFEAVHPFRDGNGRLGRLIAVISLCRAGLVSHPIVPISVFIERHRREYYDLLLRVSTHGEWEPWVRFFCEAVESQASETVARGQRLALLHREFLRKAEGKRSTPIAGRIIDALFAGPAVNAQDIARRLKITERAAQNHIDRLEEAGILTEVTGAKYARKYVARPIVRLLEEA